MTDGNPFVDDTNRRIVQLLADGYRQGEIAAEVFLSTTAVGQHVAKLRARAGAHTTAHLVAISLRRGWID